jgi:hypothetical protein
MDASDLSKRNLRWKNPKIEIENLQLKETAQQSLMMAS